MSSETRAWREMIWRFSPYGMEAARERRDRWVEMHKNEYEIVEIFVNNAFGIEYRELRTL